jgi:hypothetical protein
MTATTTAIREGRSAGVNYFEYFSEIEERFSRRRGSILLLSTLDWALIETWREAGIPLQAVLRGIDEAFDKYDARAVRSRSRKVNGLAWCAQAVMQAAEASVEAATGAVAATRPVSESGFEPQRVAAYLERNANLLGADILGGPSMAPSFRDMGGVQDVPTVGAPSSRDGLIIRQDGVRDVLTTTAQRLRELATAMRTNQHLPLDELDRTLTVLEERLFAALQAAASEDELVALRAQADRELAPYRARMSAVQLRQVQAQFLHKRLLELHALPRLSLFYMGHDD